jgi:diaminohydroxyphosphoribosylaminopyrimidine deaminase/5-amino-6-(5-phosphoribosylamino)uracil reductase
VSRYDEGSTVNPGRHPRTRREEAHVVPAKAAGTLLSEDHYRRAVVLGRESTGISGPNPPVGCVIVSDGAIVGEGATAAVGGPHAEVIALQAAGARARGATAVVTLEPCAHQGRTGPCADALIAAGVAEVHLVLRDPDPNAIGGIGRLLAAGVRVVELAEHLPDLASTVEHDLRGFLARVRSGRPHVTLKIAQTADGRTAPGPSGYLTGLGARRHVHRLRADVDAVLVGSGTIRADDPQLDVRHVESPRTPRPVVLATDAAVDPKARVVRRGALIVVGADAPAPHCDQLEKAGARVVRVASQHPTSRGLDLRAALAALLEHRILTVLAEPGPVLADALLTGGLVDDIELHLAEVVTPDGITPALRALSPLVEAWRSGDEEIEVLEIDGDTILRAAWGDLPTAAPRDATLEHVAGGV